MSTTLLPWQACFSACAKMCVRELRKTDTANVSVFYLSLCSTIGASIGLTVSMLWGSGHFLMMPHAWEWALFAGIGTINPLLVPAWHHILHKPILHRNLERRQLRGSVRKCDVKWYGYCGKGHRAAVMLPACSELVGGHLLQKPHRLPISLALHAVLCHLTKTLYHFSLFLVPLSNASRLHVLGPSSNTPLPGVSHGIRSNACA